MATRTAMLARGNISAPGTFTVSSVEAGHLWIVKDVAFVSTGGVSTNVTISALSADGLVKTEFAGNVLGATGFLHTGSLFVVLEAGDSIVIFISAGSISYWISGADLFVSTS